METIYVMPDGNIFHTQAELIEYYDIGLVENPDLDPIAFVTMAALEVVKKWGCTAEDLVNGDFTDDERLMIKVAYGQSLDDQERVIWNDMIGKMKGCLDLDVDDNIVSKTKRAFNAGWVIVVIGVIVATLLFICGMAKYNEETFVCKYPVPETSLDLRQGQRVTGTMLNAESRYIYIYIYTA